MKKQAERPRNSVKGANEVDEFMSTLDHPRKAEIEAIRALILGTDQRIHESIKWNAPSFSIGEHFATFKLGPTETVQVVLHTGAKVRSNTTAMKVDDPLGMLTWAAKDRCVATFAGMDDFMAKQAAFRAIVEQWITQL